MRGVSESLANAAAVFSVEPKEYNGGTRSGNSVDAASSGFSGQMANQETVAGVS